MFIEIKPEMLEINPFNMIGEENFLLTACIDDKWNTMTAGWGSMGYIWNKPTFTVFVRKSRYTYNFMEKGSGFTVSFFEPKYKEILKYCGKYSGRDVDKEEALGLSVEKLNKDRITFSEANLVFSLSFATKVELNDSTFINPEISRFYKKKDFHTMYTGFIENIYCKD